MVVSQSYCSAFVHLIASTYPLIVAAVRTYASSLRPLFDPRGLTEEQGPSDSGSRA